MRFVACPAAYVDSSPWYNGLDLPNANIQALLAATNPSRPDVLLPVFWMELKDLPDMLRQAGRIAKRIYFDRGTWSNLIRPGHVHKDMAAANLAIQFGWKPFVTDLWKIAMLQDSVEKRRKELSRLYSSKGLKRRIGLGSVSVVGSPWTAQVFSSHGIGATVDAHSVHTLKAWGVAHWKPNSLPEWKPTDGELRRFLAGFSPSHILTNLWEALPWSWLVDWFVPIGKTLAANNRTVGSVSSACVMMKRETKDYFNGRTIVQDASAPWSVTPGTKSLWVHHRSVLSEPSPGISCSFPSLGANQLSILGSLVISRAR